MDAGLLPVKHLDRAKGRLADRFDAPERTAIAKALLDDALDLCRSTRFMRWWVLSSDERALRAARARGLGVIVDAGPDLNAALSQAVGELMCKGATSVTIMPADVPLASAGELRDVVDVGATSDMVIVPSERDGGTNALLLRPPNVAPPRFGGLSLQAHVELAARLGLRCSILRLEGLGLDIDTAEDVDALLELSNGRAGHAVRTLRRLRPSG